MYVLLGLMSYELAVHTFQCQINVVRTQLLIGMRNWLISNQETVDLKT